MRTLIDNSHVNIECELAESNAVKLTVIRYENIKVLNQIKEHENKIKIYNDILFLIMNYPQPYDNIFDESEVEKLE